MTGPDPADAGQPDNTATPQQIAALVASLDIPHRSPRTVYETCRCCGQPTGTYWTIPRGWEPTEGKEEAMTLDRATVERWLANPGPTPSARELALAEDWLRQEKENERLREGLELIGWVAEDDEAAPSEAWYRGVQVVVRDVARAALAAPTSEDEA